MRNSEKKEVRKFDKKLKGVKEIVISFDKKKNTSIVSIYELNGWIVDGFRQSIFKKSINSKVLNEILNIGRK